MLLLIHGMAGSATTWKHVMPRLSERFTVVAPDLLGHGYSAKGVGDYSLGALASGLRVWSTSMAVVWRRSRASKATTACGPG